MVAAMVRLRFVCGGRSVNLELQTEARLRDVQQVLCKSFRQAFPKTKASVLVGGKTYEEFQGQPFLTAGDDDEVEVSFAPTDDPFGPQLHEQVREWEEIDASVPRPAPRGSSTTGVTADALAPLSSKTTSTSAWPTRQSLRKSRAPGAAGQSASRRDGSSSL
jgi:hypothetical protein